ncbi:MAG: hypothetical protein V5A84_01680, partial [Planctomycetota bacterium]
RKPGEGLYLATFSGDGGKVVVAWSTAGSRKITVNGAESAYNLMGNRIDVLSEMPVDGYPVYLAGDELRVAPAD